MAKHLPSSMWCTHLDGRPMATVQTDSRSTIKLSVFPLNKDPKDRSGFSFTIPRSLARVLARRINQCLEATK